jgi:alkanesulfonate monooxygenase SsuD/methylene tetrahydromethanopterin reductase-like flavin-dependent oxidoreductase (luciferase family)
MRFTIYCNPQTRGPEEDLEHIDLTIEQALKATEAGFDGVALTEHHASGYNTFGDNMMMAAHLAPQVRKGVRFLTTIIVPQLHHPMRLAQQCNLIDVLCRGDVIIGMGAGGSPLEFYALGRDPKFRHEHMMEVIEVVERLIDYRPGDPPYQWKTTYDEGLLSTRVMPSSFLARPRFARAAQNDQGVVWTAQRGWYLMTARAPIEDIAHRFRLYKAELAKTSLDEATQRELLDWSSLARQVVIDDTDAKAEAHARRIIDRLAEGVRRSWSSPTPDGGAAPTFTKAHLGISAEDPEAFLKGAMLVGGPETIARKLEEAEAAGVPHIKLCFNFGHMKREEADRQLDLFLGEIYPHFKNKVGTPSGIAAAAE